jgi:hypothetical protein
MVRPPVSIWHNDHGSGTNPRLLGAGLEFPLQYGIVGPDHAGIPLPVLLNSLGLQQLLEVSVERSRCPGTRGLPFRVRRAFPAERQQRKVGGFLRLGSLRFALLGLRRAIGL